MPSAAIRELEEGPNGLVQDIMSIRAYADAKAAIERNAEDKTRYPLEITPMVRMVWQIQKEIGQDRLKRKKGQGDG